MEEINIINYLDRIAYIDEDLKCINTRGAAVGFAACKIVCALEYAQVKMEWDGEHSIIFNNKSKKIIFSLLDG